MALVQQKNRETDPETPVPVSRKLPIEDSYSLYSIRSVVLEEAKHLGMNQTRIAELEIIVRELIQNVLKHGGGKGFISLRVDTREKTSSAIVLEVADKGKGIKDWDKALEPGYTTSSSLGIGLPTVNRLADELVLLKSDHTGTSIQVVKDIIAPEVNDSYWEFSFFSRPHPAEEANGDQGALIRDRKGIWVILADGLGHGPLAEEAAKKAINIIYNSSRTTPEDLIKPIHEKLVSTRGSALSIAHIIPDEHKINWVGIGNVTGMLKYPSSRNGKTEMTFVNTNGTLGVSLPSLHKMEYSYAVGDILIMSTDGMQRDWWNTPELFTSFKLPRTGLHVLKNFSRSNDDASLFIGRARL